ncbi:transcriptional regulator [Dinoroseobacter shibae DFL 12 = DSM 16493]|jgi:DNA-binding LacI/PurR family transcriptional regulator|uniref:Transcriptional regulator n=1 Tax=Dinoroseobacter shibae (strain DSM 16493 / NCIMB 14021 / DFL 12) TaxID=398580 RepID=A8LR51_DINSH|nr:MULTISPECIES: LacI family DNA-binding transcriptional regulator [Dinoroseobacter]ABV93974.1 transcriptional regulator [Dinoroseobacter shibae DFL 12 = DSM 16493]MDD9716510.1 LacI family DNA-binding transcriptional regulator [Dinoroseobacter sp. PD6]URF45419.1 LacI family DNA-binding transcriptional regulator [Dinoroseobacter shibae]URF49724.1 LacI family DNA-binding transcriptional regulator [Dinoroseobacter shibae]
MARDRVTSLDVARVAGVSQSAVSRVFTPGASVSPKTAKKVRAAAEELGYRPNVLARSLITGQSKIIGLVVAYLDNQFYPDALERLSMALQDRGYHILVFMASGTGAQVDRVIGELLDYQVDGIITASVGMSDELTKRCNSAGIPVVMFNRGQDDARLSSVTSDNFTGAREIARFLAAGGHERIAHITGWTGSSTGRDRKAGFLAGLEDAGLAAHGIVDGHYRRAEAQAAAHALFAGAAPPDAIFVGNDHMAFAVMDTVRGELGVRIPEDVSIVGYDDVPLADWGAYRLTTWRQPSNRMVAATVELLLGLIDDADRAPEKLEIAGRLIVRDSARVPADWSENARV